MAKLTPLKAIRQKCLECCNGQLVEVRECLITDCALYEYRKGHRPKTDDKIPTKNISKGIQEQLEGIEG